LEQSNWVSTACSGNRVAGQNQRGGGAVTHRPKTSTNALTILIEGKSTHPKLGPLLPSCEQSNLHRFPQQLGWTHCRLNTTGNSCLALALLKDSDQLCQAGRSTAVPPRWGRAQPRKALDVHTTHYPNTITLLAAAFQRHGRWMALLPLPSARSAQPPTRRTG